jgi:putative endonuclease
MNVSRSLRTAFHRATLCRPLTRIYDFVYQLRDSPPKFGDLGEREAERHLLRQGWFIVERGFSDRSGEIDLIGVVDQTVVFVEVKTRRSDVKGHPSEAVDLQKQRHLTKTAYSFLKKKQLTDCSFRFDIISVLWPDVTQPASIQHFQNAFEPAGRFQLV